MSWQDRVKGSITLTSPGGETFVAKWIGDNRSASKQLGIFNYPKVDKQIIQDLGILGIDYPLTLAFDGPDNDLEATRFFDSLSSRGIWLVDHPTKGRLFLQPAMFKEIVAPITSGSVTMFETEWLDVALPESVVSSAQISALIEIQALDIEAAALDQLLLNSDQSSTENILALASTTEKSLSVFDEAFQFVADTSSTVTSTVNAKVDAIRRGINDTLSVSPIDLTVLGGQIQAIMRAPAVLTGDVLGNLQAYQDFVEKIISIPGNVATRTQRNITAISEIFLVAANSSSSLLGGRSAPSTRAVAISALNLISDQFVQIADALDVIQESYEDQLLETQYFSQSESFVESSIITSQTVAYLLSISFDLAIEKRFTLKGDRAPIEITITEYGNLGEVDANFDLFIDTNALKADDILMLPAGKEVVVYV